MTKHTLYQFCKRALAVLAITALFPLNSFAANETVTVDVQNEAGSAFSGEWTLYEGSSDSGTVFWNGNASETFDVNEGTYFLKVFPIGAAYPYVAVKSSNPQTVSTDGTVTFEVQYFKTENDMIIQTGGSIDVVTSLVSGTNNYTEVIIDEFGCNRTEGEAWCQRFNECIRYWSPWCKIIPDVRVTENENPAPVPSTTSSQPTTSPSTTSYSDVPAFSTPVSGSTDNSGYQLAEAGPAGLIGMLIPAMLGGLWITRRKD